MLLICHSRKAIRDIIGRSKGKHAALPQLRDVLAWGRGVFIWGHFVTQGVYHRHWKVPRSILAICMCPLQYPKQMEFPDLSNPAPSTVDTGSGSIVKYNQPSPLRTSPSPDLLIAELGSGGAALPRHHQPNARLHRTAEKPHEFFTRFI